MGEYKLIKSDEISQNTADKLKKFIRITFKSELFKGLWFVLKQMLGGKKNTHTLFYPLEKMQLSPRYRSIHRLMRFIESENERCIGCGLCEKICVSNCIAMQTTLGDDGRKKVSNYSINYGRCVYCGLCADVCPELAIVHGDEYENASEQRAYFGFKNDLLTSKDQLSQQVEFPGYGSLRDDADKLIKQNPNAYVCIDKIFNEAEQNKVINNDL